METLDKLEQLVEDRYFRYAIAEDLGLADNKALANMQKKHQNAVTIRNNAYELFGVERDESRDDVVMERLNQAAADNGYSDFNSTYNWGDSYL